MNHAGRSLGEVSGGNRSVSKYAEFKRKSAHLCMACVFCFAKGSRTEVKMNGEAKRTRLDPVSYTHLDVYKRQIQGFAKILGGRLQ